MAIWIGQGSAIPGFPGAHAAPVLACSLRSGMNKVNVDPAPSTLRTVPRPLCAAITCWTLASPRRVPPGARRARALGAPGGGGQDPDVGLELGAGVGHEVALSLIDPPALGLVLGEHQHQ